MKATLNSAPRGDAITGTTTTMRAQPPTMSAPPLPAAAVAFLSLRPRLFYRSVEAVAERTGERALIISPSGVLHSKSSGNYYSDPLNFQPLPKF